MLGCKGLSELSHNRCLMVMAPIDSSACSSFFVGELGDYDSVSCRQGYLSEFQFFPGQVCLLDVVHKVYLYGIPC